MGVKSVGSVSFGVAFCCGCCLTIFVFGTAMVRVTVFASGLAIFFANATTLLLMLSSNVDGFMFHINHLSPINSLCATNM